MGTPDMALDPAALARTLARARGDAESVTRALWIEVRLANARQRYEETLELVRAFETSAEFRSQSDAERDGRPGVLAPLLIRAGIAAVELGTRTPDSRASARAWFDAALAMPALSQDERGLARLARANLALDSGELAAAAQELAEARALIRGPGVASSDERELDLAALELRLALERGDAPAELQTATDTLAADVQRMLALWSQQEVRSGGTGSLLYRERRRALSELFRARLILGGPEAGARAALADLLQMQAAGSFARAVNAPPLDAETALGRLTAPGRGVLVYMSGRERSHVFALGDGRVVVHELAAGGEEIDLARAELVGAIGGLRAERTAAAEQALARARERVEQAVLPAHVLASLAPWNAVVLVGLDLLGYVPFEWLRDERGEPLGLRREVSHLPSLVVGAWLAEREGARGSSMRPRVAVIAQLDGAGLPDGPASLPFEAREREAVTRAVAPDALELLAGPAATLANLRALPWKDTAYGLFLAHGVREDGLERPYGLWLAQDEVLRGDELEALAPHMAPCVFLAACNAGQGRMRRGDDGRNQLSGSLLLAGADCVIAPRVEVEYRFALAFVERFQDALLRRGLSPARALLEARATTPVAGAALELEPYLYPLVGWGDRPVVSPSPVPEAEEGTSDEARSGLVLVLAVLALGALAVRSARRR